MQATANPASNDPHDVLEIAPDIVLVARAEQELSKLARDAKTRDVKTRAATPPQPDSGPKFVEDSSVPPIDTGFRATAVNRSRAPTVGRAIRGFVGVLLAILVGGAVLTLKVSGDVAQQVIAAWIPAFAARSDSTENAAPPEQSVAQQAVTSQPAATPAAALPPVQPVDTTAQASAAPVAAPATAAASPDQAQMLQSMAHHLTTVRQELEELKGQLAELKANQEQMSRDMGKAAEQRMKLSALPPRPAASPRKPPSIFRPTPAAAAPLAPPPGAPSAANAAPPQPAAAPYAPPPAAAPYAPPPQAAAQTPYDPNAPRPPLPVRE